MNTNEAFLMGFIKAANEVGLTEGQAIDFFQKHSDFQTMLNSAGEGITHGLDQAGNFMNSHHMGDLANLIKQHPELAGALGGAGVGAGAGALMGGEGHRGQGAMMGALGGAGLGAGAGYGLEQIHQAATPMYSPATSPYRSTF